MLSGGEKSGILGTIMRVKELPEDFVVQEMLATALADRGRYAVYRVRKQAMTTLALQNQLARVLSVANSAVQFPALKDKQAVTVQFGTVRAAGPKQVKERGFVAERVGWLDRPLSPGDVVGNRFSVVLRDLDAQEVAHVTAGLEEMARWAGHQVHVCQPGDSDTLWAWMNN